MALKVILVVCLVLAASRGGDCQLGNLLGSLGDVVNSALSGASNTVNAAVNLATSVTANQGFNTGWWYNGDVRVYNLAVANAQICTQGCTDNIYNSIVQVQNDAIRAGNGPHFQSVIVNNNIVGPGVYHCWRRDYGPVYFGPTRDFAIANGYVFGRRFLH